MGFVESRESYEGQDIMSPRPPYPMTPSSKSRTLAVWVSQDDIPGVKNTGYPPKDCKDDVEDEVTITASPCKYCKWWQYER